MCRRCLFLNVLVALTKTLHPFAFAQAFVAMGTVWRAFAYRLFRERVL